MTTPAKERIERRQLTSGLCPGIVLAVLAVASVASALPVELQDSNGTRYNVNTEVDPLITQSDASGALTNATYTKEETVTNYYYFETLFGGTSTFTTQFKVDVPLTPAFVGFNGLLITSLNGVTLPTPLQSTPFKSSTTRAVFTNSLRSLVTT